MTAPDFGKELRRYRTAAGLTLRSLAGRVAFDFSYLAQVERGARTGSVRLARRCDTALSAHGYLVRLFTDQKEKNRRSRRSQHGEREHHRRMTRQGDSVPSP